VKGNQEAMPKPAPPCCIGVPKSMDLRAGDDTVLGSQQIDDVRWQLVMTHGVRVA
jgi:hypothetical protein